MELESQLKETLQGKHGGLFQVLHVIVLGFIIGLCSHELFVDQIQELNTKIYSWM